MIFPTGRRTTLRGEPCSITASSPIPVGNLYIPGATTSLLAPWKELGQAHCRGMLGFSLPIFHRWTPPGASAATSAAEDTPAEERLQRFSPKTVPQCHRYLSRRGLSPPHKTPLLCSSSAIGPSGAPRTHGDDVRTALSNLANLTPRHTPAAAARSAPEAPRTACGAPRPRPAGRRRTWRASPPSPRS
jgi:hypothetical protein